MTTNETDEIVISTHDTIIPRHMAAGLDCAILFVTSIAAAKLIGNKLPLLQLTAFMIVIPGYYFASEALFSRTVGKWVMGLIVVNYDGSKPSRRAIAVRTLFRFIEVNPLLLGALPAALSVIFSKHRQRWGDRYAKTLVVSVNAL